MGVRKHAVQDWEVEGTFPRFVIVTSPQNSINSLSDHIRFYAKQKLDTRITTTDKNGKSQYILWREVTAREEKELARGKIVMVDHSLMYPKDSVSPRHRKESR